MYLVRHLYINITRTIKNIPTIMTTILYFILKIKLILLFFLDYKAIFYQYKIKYKGINNL